MNFTRREFSTHTVHVDPGDSNPHRLLAHGTHGGHGRKLVSVHSVGNNLFVPSVATLPRQVIRGSRARVYLKLTFRDGTVEKGSEPLVRHRGTWRLG